MGGVIVIASLAVLAILMILMIAARMYRKVGPNQALIIYGFGGTRIVKGAGAIVLPMVQSCQELSLELMSFDVSPEQDLYTEQGVAVTVEAVAQIKVKSDPASIQTAAEQFLSKDTHERESMIRLVMQGHLRGIVGQLTVEQIVKEPDMVSGKMRSTCSEDLSKMGLEVVSFTIKEVKDKNEYIVNMGRPDVARIKRDADVATAEAERDTAIKRAIAVREAAIATAQADQERVIAETASLAKQAEAQRDLDLKKADYDTAVKKAQAQADKSYEIQTNVMQQQVIAEQVRVERVQKEEQIKVQEAEIQRRERELIATVLKAAEVERQKIEALAEAERQKLAIEAAGQAEAIRIQGLAEAEVIRAKGQAEADAMAMKAAAFHQYNQAAILDKLLTGFPEVVRAMAEPLAKVDKITIVSTGDGAMGADKITTDMAKMVAQVPALFETLAGVKIGDLMGKVPGLANGEEKTTTLQADGDEGKV
ncbi:MAG: flotillin family protein [Chloroflexota bacterium]